MDIRRLGHRRARKEAAIGDLVVCVDETRRHDVPSIHPKRFIGLVLDKSITVYKIQVVDTGEEMYWPESATYLWKETK
jgi:hypothetical protein